MTLKSRQDASSLIVDRRELMKGAAALGLGFGGFCALGEPARAADAPRKGGTFRIGMEGGSASDSLDPRTFANSIAESIAYQIYNGLIEIGEDGKAKGELLESWESKPGATESVFNVRKDITFHSGRPSTPTTSSIRSTCIEATRSPPPRMCLAISRKSKSYRQPKFRSR